MATQSRAGAPSLHLHAVFELGSKVASVHSSRKSNDLTVVATLSNGSAWLAARMQPQQARALARTLIEAAECVELSRRAALASIVEGGAA